MNDGIFKINYHPDFSYILIHQINNKKDYSSVVHSLKKNVKYYSSNEVGLSKSRNLAIEKSDAEYIWIMDDDVIIDNDALSGLNRLINSDLNFDMMVLSHTFKCCGSKSLSKMNKISKISKISAMSVSSIDMFIKRKSIVDKNLSFNENFGLGTKYPSGEEFIFTTQLLKSGLHVLKTNDIFSYHPPVASGNDFYSTPNKLKAKLKMFSVCYGNIIGRALYLLFIIKKIKLLKKHKKLLSAIVTLYK
ncbi:glycosyltransferase family 2 protein [Providencia manganoxydans]|uniref:glycosyltransferase family 2 protein n=1 Tax=Providencia manganoxydans TaxID=2923283 RepID=UPI0034E3A57B